jgi:hypothetical protein
MDMQKKELKRIREIEFSGSHYEKKIKLDVLTSSDIQHDNSLTYFKNTSLLEYYLNLLTSSTFLSSEKTLEGLQFIRKYVEILIVYNEIDPSAKHYFYQLVYLLRNYLLWGTSQEQLEATWILSSRK